MDGRETRRGNGKRRRTRTGGGRKITQHPPSLLLVSFFFLSLSGFTCVAAARHDGNTYLVQRWAQTDKMRANGSRFEVSSKNLARLPSLSCSLPALGAPSALLACDCKSLAELYKRTILRCSSLHLFRPIRNPSALRLHLLPRSPSTSCSCYRPPSSASSPPHPCLHYPCEHSSETSTSSTPLPRRACRPPTRSTPCPWTQLSLQPSCLPTSTSTCEYRVSFTCVIPH